MYIKSIVILLCIFVFGSFQAERTDSTKYITKLDPKEGKRVIKQCSRAAPKKVRSFFYVQDSTLSILKQEFDKIKKVKSSFNSYIKDFDRYAYQVIGMVIKKETYVYINAFPIGEKNPDDVKKYWREKAVVVCDGGHGYWGVLFNVEQKTFSELHRNGPGPYFIE